MTATLAAGSRRAVAVVRAVERVTHPGAHLVDRCGPHLLSKAGGELRVVQEGASLLGELLRAERFRLAPSSRKASARNAAALFVMSWSRALGSAAQTSLATLSIAPARSSSGSPGSLSMQSSSQGLRARAPLWCGYGRLPGPHGLWQARYAKLAE